LIIGTGGDAVVHLSIDELGEHFLGIDCDKQSAATSQHFAVGIQNLRHVDVLSSVRTHFAGFDKQGFIERHGLQVVHRDLRGQRDHVAQFVYLAHSLIQDSCDNAAVGMARRSGVAFAEAEAADEAIAFFVISELEAHSFRIVLPAGKAIVLLQADIGSVVALAR
jgi:hypothetical protein